LGGSIKKILIVFGTRPEAIKMGPLIHELRKFDQDFLVKVCVTGQHRVMLDKALKDFDIVPDFDLNLMTTSQNLAHLSGLILIEIRNILVSMKPDLVLIQGDTTTTLMTALASFYEDVAVAHIEAGLRTFDLRSPFPEELNRQIVSKIAKWHFTPTKTSQLNLIQENVPAETIFITGNTIVDSLFWSLNQIAKDPHLKSQIVDHFEASLPIKLENEKFILVTGHRRENFGAAFEKICFALQKISLLYPEIHVIYPVHLNPNVQGPVNKILGHIKNIHLIKPQNYHEFIYLLKYCHFVLTDSGGIQEEAPSLKKPILLIREKTERLEGIESGVVKLVGTETNKIVESVSKLLTDANCYNNMIHDINPYGDGKSVQRIIEVLRTI